MMGFSLVYKNVCCAKEEKYLLRQRKGNYGEQKDKLGKNECISLTPIPPG